jgi:hypothetical protein
MNKSTGGFSVTEIMVALGLVSVVAVGILKLAEVNLKSSRTAAVNYELGSFKDEIRQFLSSSENCTKSFQKNGNSFIDFKSNMSTVSFNTIKRDDGSVNGVSKYDNNTKYRDGTLKIKTIQIGPYIPNNSTTDLFSGATRLFITYEKQGLVFGTQTVTQAIELTTALEGGTGSNKNNLRSCSAKIEVASNNECGTKKCVRAEIANAVGEQCFEVDSTGSCSIDYPQAGTATKNVCVYVIRDEWFSGAQTAPPEVQTIMLNGNFPCPGNIGSNTIPPWTAFGHTFHSSEPAQLHLTQKTYTVKICCRKNPP